MNPVPLMVNFQQMRIEPVISFVLGLLFAVTVNAEAQAFMATSLGDQQVGNKKRFHFNPFFHLDVLGVVAFLLGGFGWSRHVAIDPGKFAHPRLYTIMTRFTGPLANLLLAGIGGSIMILTQLIQSHPGLFPGIVAINVAVAVYNLIPIPPLAAGSLWTVFIPARYAGLERGMRYGGALLLVGVLVVDRLQGHTLLGPIFDPIILRVYTFVMGQPAG